MFNKTIKYIGGVKQEMSKVIWPTRLELRDSSVIVLVLALMLAIFIFGIDFILNNILKVIF